MDFESWWVYAFETLTTDAHKSDAHKVWNAAYAQGIADAAKVAESRTDLPPATYNQPESFIHGYRLAHSDIAYAIRKLAKK